MDTYTAQINLKEANMDCYRKIASLANLRQEAMFELLYDHLLSLARPNDDTKLHRIIRSILEMWHTSLTAKKEKEALLERVIEEKDLVIRTVQAASDMASFALESNRIKRQEDRPGSLSRHAAWKVLQARNHAHTLPLLEEETYEDDRKDNLVNLLNGLDKNWSKETEMYTDLLGVLQKGLYPNEPGMVHDTHKHASYAPDLSISQFSNSYLPYTVQFFVEVKLPSAPGKLASDENLRQIMDYFNTAQEKQPRRVDFVAVLSNTKETFILFANYGRDGVDIVVRPVANFAYALIHADCLSRSQYTERIPNLDPLFSDKSDVVAISQNHWVLSVPKPGNEEIKNSASWVPPTRFVDGKTIILKIGRRGRSVGAEIEILKRIRDQTQPSWNLPQLVWSPQDELVLGIVPQGKPIDFTEPPLVSRQIIEGLIDGIEYLHHLGIIHRDIRPSNVVLAVQSSKHHPVIVDFENSVLEGLRELVAYEGACIAWPIRVLTRVAGQTTDYIPEFEDDLKASILMVLHMLFPHRFGAFNAHKISPGTPNLETQTIMRLWDSLKGADAWQKYVKAAEDKDYKVLRKMASFFHSV